MSLPSKREQQNQNAAPDIPSELTDTRLISEQLAYHSTDNEGLRSFLLTAVAEFEDSETYVGMKEGQKYYENKNEILERVREVIGRDSDNNPCLVESKVLSNNRLAHNFVKKLTRQKISYMLGKMFTLASDLEETDERATELFGHLKPFFDKDFLRRLKNVARDSIVKTIGWVHPYYNESGDLKFKRFAPEEIIPFWKDIDHTILDAFVHRYNIETYEAVAPALDGVPPTQKKITTYIDYYTLEGIFHFVVNGAGHLVPRNDVLFHSPHFQIRAGNTAFGVNWKRIPLVPFKYDPDEQSLLDRIKTLVDDYDLKTSELSNVISDFPNSETVIKGYDGDSKEEFISLKNSYRTIFVQNDGDAKGLENKVDYNMFDSHLARLREDIYEFGQGVDTTNKDIRDTSGVALRFLYADLDMDCVDWACEMEWSIMQLIWFIRQDLARTVGDDFEDVVYSVLFNTSVIVNESEEITNAFNSYGIISNETLAANHPWVRNATMEVSELMKERGAILELQKKYAVQQKPEKIEQPGKGAIKKQV
jgi:SPP1 family phage portal protein